MIEVLLADGHAVVRRHLRRMLEQSGDCEICGEAANGRDAVDLAIRLKPAVVILDFELPEMHGLEAARRIQAAWPDTGILILTMHHTEELVSEALAAGARSYIQKSDAASHLVLAVRALSRREPYFTPELTPALLRRFLSGRPAP